MQLKSLLFLQKIPNLRKVCPLIQNFRCIKENFEDCKINRKNLNGATLKTTIKQFYWALAEGEILQTLELANSN